MKSTTKNIYILLFLIVIVGTFLRFYRIQESPKGFYVDEAAIGYNAYSILETGKDEYGKTFPIYFRSFGDYKMPLYIYFSIVPIKLFGLSIFSVRFVSVFFGSLTIAVVFFLTKKLFPNKDNKFALFVSLLFSIAPLSVFFSRMALEVSLALFMLLIGLYFQLIFFERKKYLYVMLSIIFYAMSSYSYHTEKFISPMIFVVVAIIYFLKEKIKTTLLKTVVFPTLIYFIMMLPQIMLFNTVAGQARINSLSLSRDLTKVKQIINYISSYSAYFSPKNLFFDPDPNLQRSLPELSVFYPWMVIPFFAGLIIFLRKKKEIGEKILISILLISPIPASIAGDPFSSFRAYPIIFPVLLIITIGLEGILSRIKSHKMKYLTIAGIVSVSLLSLLRSNFVLLPNERYSDWSYGYSQLIQEINKYNGKKILIDDPIGTGYVEILFFQKYPPKAYQETNKNDLSNYYQINGWNNKFLWSNIEIGAIYWRTDVVKDQLIVAGPLAISPGQAKEHFFIKAFAIIGPDGKEIFNGYMTNPKLKIEDGLKKAKLNI